MVKSTILDTENLKVIYITYIYWGLSTSVSFPTVATRNTLCFNQEAAEERAVLFPAAASYFFEPLPSPPSLSKNVLYATARKPLGYAVTQFPTS